MRNSLYLKLKKIISEGVRVQKKFRYLIKEKLQKSLVQKDLSACVEDHFNSFEIVKKFQEGERKKMYRPLDFVYKHVKNIDQIVSCCFLPSMRQAYCVVLRDRGKQGMESTTAGQCYACQKLFIQARSLENHMRICSKMLGLVC